MNWPAQGPPRASLTTTFTEVGSWTLSWIDSLPGWSSRPQLWARASCDESSEEGRPKQGKNLLYLPCDWCITMQGSHTPNSVCMWTHSNAANKALTFDLSDVTAPLLFPISTSSGRMMSRREGVRLGESFVSRPPMRWMPTSRVMALRCTQVASWSEKHWSLKLEATSWWGRGERREGGWYESVTLSHGPFLPPSLPPFLPLSILYREEGQREGILTHLHPRNISSFLSHEGKHPLNMAKVHYFLLIQLYGY